MINDAATTVLPASVDPTVPLPIGQRSKLSVRTMQRCVVILLALLCVVGCRANSSPNPTSIEATQPGLAAPVAETISVDLSPEEVMAVEILAMLTSTTEPRTYESHPSPDGAWRAEILIYACTSLNDATQYAYEELLFTRLHDRTVRTADSQLIHCDATGAYGLEGLFWSPNSRYFYYTDARESMPDGCGEWQAPVFRAEVDTVSKESIGSGPRSPDRSALALWRSGQLLFWQLDNGEQRRLSPVVPDAVAGAIAWSPDSRSIAYLQNSAVCPLMGPSYVVLVDTRTYQQHLLLESTTPLFDSLTWTEENQLSLLEPDGVEWKYDLESGELRR